METERSRFILRNSISAILWLALIAIAYILFVEFIYVKNPGFWIDKFYGQPIIIYSIYVFSEFFFGLFPPELFMLWAVNKGSVWGYFANLFFFTVVSYGAAHVIFFLGRFLSSRFSEKLSKLQFYQKMLPSVKKYGAPLIIIAALTPVPWTTVALIMGAIGFDYKKFTLYGLSRVARFIVYGYVVFHTHHLL